LAKKTGWEPKTKTGRNRVDEGSARKGVAGGDIRGLNEEEEHWTGGGTIKLTSHHAREKVSCI